MVVEKEMVFMRTSRTHRADLIVGTILSLILGTFALAQVENAEETLNRIKCASNLRQIGQGLLLYSNDNRGAYPRTTADIKDPMPTWGTPYEGNDKLGLRPPAKADPFDPKKSDVAVKPNDVTAALFLVLRTQDIMAGVFICPSTGSPAWEFGGKKNSAQSWTNWPGKKGLADHLSYSYQNPYPTKEAIGKGFKMNNSVGAEFAMAADMNPGIDALIKVPMEAGEDAIRIGNSANHGGEGQNVLYGDGHVEFQTNPYVGAHRDNIYTYGDSGTDHKGAAGTGIVGSPAGPNDSILLPTAKDLGVVDANGKLNEVAQKRRLGVSPDMKPATPEQQEATRQKIMGNYVQTQGGRRIKLQITKDQLIGSSGPITITFGYRIVDIGDGGVARLVLTAPETTDASTVIEVENDGVTFKGGQMQGKWMKQ
jgi:prepilin-type processing-associated H-X9-DG protein